MPNDFLAQFQAGFQMGQSRNENARRNQEMQMEQLRAQQEREQRAAAFTLQQEEFALRKKQLAAEEHAHKLNAAKEAFQQQVEANSMRNLPPPTAADVGIPEQGPEFGGPMASEINVPQPTMAMPSAMQGQPDVQMPVPTGRQQQDMAQAEQQRKMREALGLLMGQEQVKAQFRKPEPTIQDIFNEAKARAAGGRAGAPPESGGSSAADWVEMVGPNQTPVQFNRKTQEIRPYPQGVQPKPTGRQALSGEERSRFASINYVYPRIDSFISYVESNPDLFGAFDSKKTALKQMMPVLTDSDLASQSAFVGRMNAEIRKAMYGAAVSKGEQAQADTFLITKNDQPAVIAEKMLRAKEKMASDVDYYRGLGYNVGAVSVGASDKPKATGVSKADFMAKYGIK
jgi:hypothetical protein